MKKVKKSLLLCLSAAALLIVLILNVFCGTGTAKAEIATTASTGTYISAYKISYDVNSDRSMSVTEDITVNFAYNTGFYHYIPVNAGEQVKNIAIYELIDGKLTDVYYDVSLSGGAVYVDVGDYTTKNGEYTYRINYDYCLTKAQEGNNLLALTPVGADWPCSIENIEITVNLPKGYIVGSASCFVNYGNQSNNITYSESTADGLTTLYADIDKIASGSEVRLDLSFEDGAMSTYFDFTPFWYIVIAAAILLILVLLKVFVFNKSSLTPVVNYEAPNKMDPLIMGKLIDNKVNSEDITSMIYYWASKGYLKINLDDKDDPVLIRIVKNLPATCEGYEQVMYNGLFADGDVVKPSRLKGRFYKTVEKVSAMVNAGAKGLYESKSIGISIIFAVIGGLLLGLTPFILAKTQISGLLTYLPGFIALVPALIIYALTETVMYYRLKLSKGKLIGMSLGIFLLCALFTLLYVFLLPSAIMGVAAKIILCIICCAIITGSVLLINRTKEYTDKLNDIVGFRNFIMLAEKDQLEMMLEEDPQFYYHILPYAQVLGVSDKWEDKFAELTVEPPQWLTGNIMSNVIEFHIINSMIRNSMGRMSSNMISRPSSSGLSGGGHGGFGGFSGGGHGGGGGGFR